MKISIPILEKYKAQMEFQRGGASGGSNQRPSVGGVWIFLEQYILLYLISELPSQ